MFPTYDLLSLEIFGLHHLWAGVQGVLGKRGKEAKQRGQLTDSSLV